MANRSDGPHPELYIVSYPKSGRTWLRALLGRYLVLKYGLPETDLLDTERVTRAAHLPVTAFTHDGSEMLRGAPHQALTADKSHYSGKKVVFLSRDIKDTLVSAYYQAVKRIGVFQGPIAEFIRSERYGARKIAAFYDSWYRNWRTPADFLMVRYEDMHGDTAAILTRVLEFMGEKGLRAELIAASVAYCSFENLREAEKADRFRTSILRPGSVTDPDSYKLREGKIGGHVKYLSPADIQYIDEVIRSAGLRQFEMLGIPVAGGGVQGSDA